MGLGARAKSLVRRAANSAGYNITKLADRFQLDLYRRLYDAGTLQRKPFYNVGAGAFYHPYWTNLDFVSDWYGDVQQHIVPFDLMKLEPLPVEDGSAKVIYTSHTIEHVKEAAVRNLFREAYRALERGGIFRVTTGPDAVTDFRALQNGDEEWFYWDKWYAEDGYGGIYTAPPTSVSLAERWLHHVASPLSRIDRSPSEKKFGEQEIWAILREKGLEGALDFFCGLCAFDPQRPGNHISWWTHEKVMEYMREAGFTSVYRSGYNQSASPLLRHSDLFDSTHPQISLYVEAKKA
jgi:hypothetical protein